MVVGAQRNEKSSLPSANELRPTGNAQNLVMRGSSPGRSLRVPDNNHYPFRCTPPDGIAGWRYSDLNLNDIESKSHATAATAPSTKGLGMPVFWQMLSTDAPCR